MRTKEYPSLGMTLAHRDPAERQAIIMKQIGELPLGQHMFDEGEMAKMADKIGPLVENICAQILDAAVELGREVNDSAAYAFIYLASQGVRDHMDALATNAAHHLAYTGTDLLRERMGAGKLDQLIAADARQQDDGLAAILAALATLSGKR